MGDVNIINWQERLTGLLDFIENSAKSSIDIINKETPLFIQDIINYGIVYHGIMTVAMLLGLVVSAITCFICYKKIKPFFNGKELTPEIAMPVVFLMSSFIFGICAIEPLFSHLRLFIMAEFAPRRYLLEVAVEYYNWLK